MIHGTMVQKANQFLLIRQTWLCHLFFSILLRNGLHSLASLILNYIYIYYKLHL